MKSLNWLLLLVISAAFVGALASMQQIVSLSFNGWDVNVPFGAVFFVLFVVIIFCVMIDRLIQNLGFFERWQKQRQMRKARALMLQGFGHLATRDLESAQKSAKEIEKLWQDDARDPFRLVFEGRLAEEEGAWDKAQHNYNLLEANKDTRLYALRAQLRLAYTKRDNHLIRKLSAKALKLAPEDLSLYTLQIEALTDNGQWHKAHQLLHKIERKSIMAIDMVQHKKMEIYLNEADEKMAQQKFAAAKHLAQKAGKIKPSTEAARLEIEALIAGNHRKAALKKLQKAWGAEADGLLLPMWEALAPKQDKLTFYESMLSVNANAPQTHLALIKAAIHDNRITEARGYMDALERHRAGTLEYAESREMMARLVEHDKKEAAQWKDRSDMLRMAQRGTVNPNQVKLTLRDPLEQ